MISKSDFICEWHYTENLRKPDYKYIYLVDRNVDIETSSCSFANVVIVRFSELQGKLPIFITMHRNKQNPVKYNKYVKL